MRLENYVSMLDYLRQAIGIWRRYPFKLTVPMVVATWLTLPGSILRRFSSRLHFVVELSVFALAFIVSYVARTFVSRIVGDLQEGAAADWQSALALCFKPIVLQTGVGLAGRFLLRFLLALVITFVFAAVIYVPAAMTHHGLPHGWLRTFLWVAALLVAACVSRYSFAIPYVAFARGEIAAPIELSVTRTKPILRPLMWLVVCGSALALTIGRLFRVVGLYLALTPGKEMAWGMLRDTVEAIPNACFAIAVSLIAYQDFVAMKDGGGFTAVEKPAIELIDGLPAYQPPATKHFLWG